MDASLLLKKARGTNSGCHVAVIKYGKCKGAFMDVVILTLNYFFIFFYFTDTNAIFPKFPDKCLLTMVEQISGLLLWTMSTVAQHFRNSVSLLR
jgi:hypothetical protein